MIVSGPVWFHVLKGRNLDWYVKDNRIAPFLLISPSFNQSLQMVRWLILRVECIFKISQTEDVTRIASLGGGQLVRVQPAVSQAAVQLYSLAVSLPIKH